MEFLRTLKNFLDTELNIDSIDDACSNGLEIDGREEIRKIIFMVDPSEQGIQEAIKHNGDMIIVHHGLFFGSIRKLDGFLYKRIKLLMKHNISLYAAHLPLDVHPSLGNNVQMAKILSLQKIKQYDVRQYKNLLTIGEFNSAVSRNDFLTMVQRKVNKDIRHLDFGPQLIRSVGIITGSGAEATSIAAQYGAETFITGESKLQAFHESKELNINIVFAGHYNTEVFGLKALRKFIQNKFSVETIFIDIPTVL